MNPNFIFYIIGGFIVFMVLREFVTWYWKLNRVTELLEKIEENTRPKTTNTTATPSQSHVSN